MSQSELQANKELVREWVEVLEAGEFDRIPDFFADDFTYEKIQLDEETSAVGYVDDIVENVEAFHRAFPDVSQEIAEMAAEGDWVLYRIEGEGTHEGEWRGIEPTGTEVSYQVHQSRRIENGEFVEIHGTFSVAWILSQLGVDLPTESED